MSNKFLEERVEDLEKEVERLTNELEMVKAFIGTLNAKLNKLQTYVLENVSTGQLKEKSND